MILKAFKNHKNYNNSRKPRGTQGTPRDKTNCVKNRAAASAEGLLNIQLVMMPPSFKGVPHLFSPCHAPSSVHVSYREAENTSGRKYIWRPKQRKEVEPEAGKRTGAQSRKKNWAPRALVLTSAFGSSSFCFWRNPYFKGVNHVIH